MAKRGIADHPKTLKLAQILGICPPYAVGLLEVFWHWVAKYKPNGDVSDTEATILGQSLRYTGDTQAFWDAMLEVGFLDQNAEGKTIVHHWSEHADKAVKIWLKRRKLRFADGSRPSTELGAKRGPYKKNNNKDLNK